MSGTHLTTISPSRTSSSRKTPCVEGCCGPNEMVICVSSGRSTTSNAGGRFVVGALMLLVFSESLAPEEKSLRLRLEVVSQRPGDPHGLARQERRREPRL